MSVNPIKGKFVRLQNDEALKARNQADSADVEILKVNADDDIELISLPVFDDGTSVSNVATEKYVDAEVATVSGDLGDHIGSAADAHDASAISFSNSYLNSNISATEVQAAIQELDSEKVKKSGDTMSGLLDITAVGQIALEVNDLIIGEPWGAGSSVISVKDGSADQLYVQSADQLGAFAGTNSSVAQFASGWVGDGATSGIVNVQSGDAMSGDGNVTGAVSLKSGQILGPATGSSGDLSLQTGIATGTALNPQTSGQVVLESGIVSDYGDSGNVVSRSGATAAGDSGMALVFSGDSQVQGASGAVGVFSGSALAGNSGSAQINTGNATTGSSGFIAAFSGDATTGSSGTAQINTGNATTGNSGGVYAFSGGVVTGNSGAAQLYSGAISTQGSSGALTAVSGQIIAGTGNSGSAQIASGYMNVDATGASGLAALNSGDIANPSSISATGNIIVRSGTSAGLGVTGGVRARSGNISNSSSAAATGVALLYSGFNAGSGSSGELNVYSGDNTGTGATGTAQIQSGVISNAASSASTGFAQVRSGNNAGSGSSGIVFLASGNNTGTGDSGNISLATGSVVSGARGKITLNSSLAEVYSQLNMNTNKITGLATGTANGDAIEFLQYTTALGLKADKDLSNLVIAPSGAYSFKSDVNFVNSWNSVKSADATGSADSGGIGFKSGDADSGNSGLVALGSGDSVSGEAGNVTIFSGVGASGRGYVQIEASMLNLLNAIDMNSHSIDNLVMTTSASCAATKQYVDNVAEGLHIHAPARLIATVDLGGVYDNGPLDDGIGSFLDLSGSPVTAIDSVTSFSVGDRIILAKQQGSSLSIENGIYYIKDAADIDSLTGYIVKLSRTLDFNTPAEMAGGDFVFVQEGNLFADSGWVMSETIVDVGVTPVQFLQFSGAGAYQAGDALLLTGNEFDVLFDDSSIGKTVLNKLEVKALGIVEGKIATGAVTADKIGTDAVTAVKINSDVAGLGLVKNGTSKALDVNVGNGIQIAETDKVAIKLDGSSLAVSGDGIKSNIIWHKESYAISADLSAGAFFDLGHVAEVDSISAFVDRLAIHEGASEDYSVGYTDGIGGVTRIYFLNTLVTIGQQRLGSGDTIFFKYQRKAA